MGVYTWGEGRSVVGIGGRGHLKILMVISFLDLGCVTLSDRTSSGVPCKLVGRELESGMNWSRVIICVQSGFIILNR